jgi:hypothetical protein
MLFTLYSSSISIIYKKGILGMLGNFGFKGEQKMLLYFLSWSMIPVTHLIGIVPFQVQHSGAK